MPDHQVFRRVFWQFGKERCCCCKVEENLADRRKQTHESATFFCLLLHNPPQRLCQQQTHRASASLSTQNHAQGQHSWPPAGTQQHHAVTHPAKRPATTHTPNTWRMHTRSTRHSRHMLRHTPCSLCICPHAGAACMHSTMQGAGSTASQRFCVQGRSIPCLWPASNSSTATCCRHQEQQQQQL